MRKMRPQDLRRVVISDVARRYGVPPQRLFAWRNQMRTPVRKQPTVTAEFAPVVVTTVAPTRPSATQSNTPTSLLILT